MTQHLRSNKAMLQQTAPRLPTDSRSLYPCTRLHLTRDQWPPCNSDQCRYCLIVFVCDANRAALWLTWIWCRSKALFLSSCSIFHTEYEQIETLHYMLKSRNVHYAASVTVTTLMQPITNVRLQVNKNYRGHQDNSYSRQRTKILSQHS